MLRTKSLFVFLVLLGLSTQAHASSGGGNIMRGGLGFLFPDHNQFVNPGQFADSRAMAVEAYYGRTGTSPAAQTLTPSLVYGNGTIGIGAYGTRAAVDLLNGPTTDVVGGGFGVSLLKGRATIGVGYQKDLSATTDSGDATATLTLNPPNRKGVAVGVGYTRGLTTATNALTAGVGYSFMSNSNFELNIRFADISALSNWTGGAYFTCTKNMVYFGGGYLAANNGTLTHGAAGRLGFVLGRSVDLSAWANYYFVTGSTVTYGGSFRASF